MFTIKNVSKQFGEEYALRDISMEIGRGLNFIIGASGSGKTTLLKILSGMEQDFTGDVDFCGKNMKVLPEDEKSKIWSSKFGFVWQDFNLLEECTVLENVLLPRYVGQGADIKLAQNTLRELSIGELAYQKVNTLSGGQKQRVAIARELMKNPQVIFADEPTSALDTDSAKIIMDILRMIAKKRIVIIVTHDTSLIDARSKVYEFDKGELVASASSDGAVVRHDTKENEPNGLSVEGAFSLSLTAVKRHIGRVLISILSILIASTLLLVSVGGAVSDNGKESIDKLLNTYGKSLFDISVVNSFMSASGTDNNEKDEPNADVTQNIDGLFEKYKADSRVEHVLFAQAFDNIKITIDGKTHSVQASGNMPVMNKLLAGEMPMGDKNEVAVPESFVKKMGISNEEIIGKEMTFNATVYNWESGEAVVVPVSANAKIVGVIDSNMVVEYEGQTQTYPIDDSFFFTPSALNEMREKVGMKPDPGAFYIRAKSAEDLIAIKDELNADGIVPLGQFELVEDFVRLNNQTQEQSGTAVVVIVVLSLVIVVAIALLGAMLRRREYAIFKVSGFSKKHLSAFTIAEHTILICGAAVLFVITSPLLNLATTALWKVNLLNGKMILIGVLFTIITGVISLAVTVATAMWVKVSNALLTGDR